MTREEAIKIFNDWDGIFHGHNSDDVNEALNMAIEELSKEPCAYAISKEQFISRYREWSKDEFGRIPAEDCLAFRVANTLPTVQPAKPTFEGMSNGEVFRKLFPSLKINPNVRGRQTVLLYDYTSENDFELWIPLDWWNEPYCGTEMEGTDE